MTVEKFFFCEPSERSVQRSYDIITSRINSGFLDSATLPDEIVPTVVDEETEWLNKFKEGQFDLIVNNMTLHWLNEIEQTLRTFNHTLEPDGVFMSTSLGGNTLQEVRIAFNLAE